MVPTSLIITVLLVAFLIAWFAYFMQIPERLILSRKFLLMGGPAAVMLFTVILAIIDVQVVWLSWVLLGTAILWLAASIPQFRSSLAASRARERLMNEHRARGR
jgi:type IV secretory pathway TrbD component